jgi:glycosyltransferase involved in cell wall biosynthesis
MLKFSIIIPIFNAAGYLDNCLRSCINQTYTNIEIICVDDCSSDSSSGIIKLYQNKDERIKSFLHKKNESQYIARRTGAINATGDYILFLDSDDTLRIDACAILSKKIKNVSIDIIQFGYKETPSGKNVFSPFYKTSKERISAYLAKENRYSPAVWTKAYSRTLIKKAYESMETFYASGPEDIYTSIAITCFAHTFCYLKIPLVNYSIGTGMSTNKQYSIEKLISWLISYKTVIQKTRSFIKKYIPEFIDKCFDMELYILKDFLFCRMPPDLSVELKHQVFSALPSYFSENILDLFYKELIYKYNAYNTYLNFSCSLKIKTKKLIKIIILYIKSLPGIKTIFFLGHLTPQKKKRLL